MGSTASELSPYKIIGNLFIPSTKEIRAHKLVENTPYPSRSPYGYERLPPTVIHVPKREIEHFLNLIVKRYIRTLKRESLSFFTRKSEYISQTDEELEEMIVHSAFARFLNPKFDPADYDIFSSLLKQNKKDYYKIDLTHLGKMQALKNYHCVPLKALLEKGKSSVKIKAIWINELLITPNDIDWKRAKLFFTTGLCVSILIHEHPKQHFGYDAINGLTKCHFPEKHPIYRLLKPHLYMQLPLNFAVLYVNKSVALNDQNEPYTCFPNTRAGTIASLAASYEGIEGNSSYPKFKYNLGPDEIPYDFGKFLASYWHVIYEFVKKFVSSVTPGDPVISSWARDCAFFVPGFPNEQEIWQEDNLIRALTTFIHNVSFAHAADHYTYSKTDINKVPSRVRVAPPTKDNRHIPLDPRKVFTRTDLHKHHLAMEMFFKPTNLITILETQYLCLTQAETIAVAEFKDDLEINEEKLTTRRYIPLAEVACSIQY